MKAQELETVIQEVLNRYELASNKTIPIETSARHVHLTQEAVEVLFGSATKLINKRDLSQPGEFLSEQRVKLVTAKGTIENVAVLGPVRSATQCELSMTDCRTLGIVAPINLSGNLQNAGDVIMVGTHGVLDAKNCVIVARAHIHLTPASAKEHNLTDGQHVKVTIHSLRSITLDDVVVRVKESFATAMHIDFDESNACLCEKNTKITIHK